MINLVYTEYTIPFILTSLYEFYLLIKFKKITLSSIFTYNLNVKYLARYLKSINNFKFGNIKDANKTYADREIFILNPIFFNYIFLNLKENIENKNV